MVALPLYFAIVDRLFGFELVKQSDREVASTFVRLMLDGLRPPERAAAREVRGANGTVRSRTSRRKKR